MGLPGWNSIQVTGSLSNLFFWLSIAALVMLGLAEVFSHRYGERHDLLVAQQRQAEKDASDGEIARLHRDTAQANARVLEAQLALEQFKAPRQFNVGQQGLLGVRLRQFAPVRVDILTFGDTSEIASFGRHLGEVLERAGWKPKVWSVFNGASFGVTGVPVFAEKGSQRGAEAGAALVEALTLVQVSAKKFDDFEGAALPTSVNGPPWDEKDIGAVRVYVGAKPQ
jgi:hypothetical protein